MSLPVLNSLKHASCRDHFFEWNLRTTGLVSTITMTIMFSFRRIIDAGGKDGWGRRVHNRRWSSFGVNGVLAHLLFFIRVIEDDDVAIVERPKNPRLRSPKSLLANYSSHEVLGKSSYSLEERSTI
jgi:hypothetical protein